MKNLNVFQHIELFKYPQIESSSLTDLNINKHLNLSIQQDLRKVQECVCFTNRQTDN